mmetsp:Transcript_1144/g.3358  ORF Transcript_1144/g.3358 Transcript_1144/m.3358 type:complete len:223 (+) Transcript_1144:1035-1703(+)
MLPLALVALVNDKLTSSSTSVVIFGASSSTVPPTLSTTSSKPSSVEESDRLFQRKTPLLPACVVARYSSVGESAKLVILSDPIFIVCNKRAEGMSKTLSIPRVSQEIIHSRSEVISTFVAKTSFFFFFFFLLPSAAVAALALSFSSPLLFSLFKRNVRTRFLVPISNTRTVPSCEATANNSAVLCKEPVPSIAGAPKSISPTSFMSLYFHTRTFPSSPVVHT